MLAMMNPKVRLVLIAIATVLFVLNGCDPFIPETW